MITDYDFIPPVLTEARPRVPPPGAAKKNRKK
jgi:hypothetical protein